jgi:hypothetical protein
MYVNLFIKYDVYIKEFSKRFNGFYNTNFIFLILMVLFLIPGLNLLFLISSIKNSFNKTGKDE